MVEVAVLLLKYQIKTLKSMKYWPVPNSYSRKIPKNNEQGSFWEKRQDRYHCGIDIYASKNSEVISMDDGTVFDLGIFTSPDRNVYWNVTKYVLIENKDNIICKYAELGKITVKIDEKIKAGQLIGYIGTVLNVEKITKESPLYIQKIKENNNLSMLHFEIYNSKPIQNKKYLGGNWFSPKKPKNLLNPTLYLPK